MGSQFQPHEPLSSKGDYRILWEYTFNILLEYSIIFRYLMVLTIIMKYLFSMEYLHTKGKTFSNVSLLKVLFDWRERKM